MELREYLRILRRRGWIVLLVAILTAAAALGVSKLLTPVYKASVKVSAVPARPDWGGSQATKDVLSNFVINIKTHRMAERVIDHAQLDMSSYDLLEKLEVGAELSNFTIDIAVRDPDPGVAVQIAQTLAEIFVDDREEWNQRQDKSDRIDVVIVDDARDAPLFRPNLMMNGIAGAILGALIGLLIVYLLEWLEADLLRNPQVVERAIGVPVLGSIPTTQE
ncbi:MAG TPA: Wzz/FepE/Etk N-terminal domain-containing protein [Anaerolineae bacterium]|nr:Wzz/FepE/Etk N-terminal domain-containing protein [Anaerolineae bacterium]